ncbi:FtsX-like permease family protein [Lactobacillus sp. Sy-1]|nr:FtsX-like permease family protein [Lactobacillus sp. Sy-1]
MKKTLNQNIFREFKFSFARFISIVILISLGVYVLVGLKVTGHDMRITGNNYYTAHKMADAYVEGNTSFTRADQKYIKQLPHVSKAEFSTYRDAVIKNTHTTVRLLSNTSQISTNNVTKGRLPKAANEIALNNSERGKYQIGDSITFANNKNQSKVSGLKQTTFKIVGFVTSSDYINKQNLGTTTAGTGELNSFGVITKAAFKNYQPTVAKLDYNNLRGSSYDNEFENQIQQNVNDSQRGLNHRANLRQAALVNRAKHKINQQATELKRQQTALNKRRTQLSASASRLSATQRRQANRPIKAAQARIDQAKQKLQTTSNKLNSGNRVTYQIQSRNDYNLGYNEYGENSRKIDLLSNSFPIIFFAVAILVCVITMSRMGEESRIQLGTLRALGYSKFDTMKVFLSYGFLSGLIGTGLGAWIGTTFLPTQIFKTYSANFSVPDFHALISVKWILISLLISLVCTTVPGAYVAGRSLKEYPATLMLPKKPKRGAKILLERVPFIWKRLSFNYKVTFRNIFRFKLRMMMTILGVMGCTALLITGFGMRDSLSGVNTKQYHEIVHYDIISIFNPSATTKQKQAYERAVNNTSGIKYQTQIYYEGLTAKPRATNNQSVSLMVPKQPTKLNQFITLQNPDSNKAIRLSNNGAIITDKLAHLTNTKVGGHITLTNSTGKHYRIKVSGITQMYVGHSVYMNANYYHHRFGKRVAYNANMLKLNNRSDGNINRVASDLNQQPAALTSIQSNGAKKMVDNLLGGLNNIVLIITIAASALAFVVLFTLTNINVSERERELATIKVLGFYPGEVIMYVFRETFILTFVGILVGFVGGAWLHNFIMQTLPPDNAHVDLTLLWTNFATSAGLTIIFAFMVMFLMASKIKNIDMLGALKGVD